jgi:hypothetical protein
MAQPNIVSVVTIRGNTAVAAVTNVSSNLVVNSDGSGQVLKLNALYISNIHATGNTAVVSASVLRTGVEYRVASNVNLTANSTLDVISKAIYLQEGDCLRISANSTLASNVNNLCEAVCSFEAIS